MKNLDQIIILWRSNIKSKELKLGFNWVVCGRWAHPVPSGLGFRLFTPALHDRDCWKFSKPTQNLTFFLLKMLFFADIILLCNTYQILLFKKEGGRKKASKIVENNLRRERARLNLPVEVPPRYSPRYNHLLTS